MPLLPSAPIDQFDEYNDPKAVDYLVIFEKASGKTLKIKASYFGQAAPSTNYKWSSTFDYAEDAIVEHLGKWYLSLQTPNLGKNPATQALFWEEQAKASAGFVFWAAGVFTGDVVLVLYELAGITYIFRLIDATRPYLSADFEAELAAGDWGAIGGVVAGTGSHWRGGYDASTDLYPAANGSTGGVPQAGDEYYLTVGGDLDVNGLGVIPVYPGALLKSLINTPGQTPANWKVVQ